MTAAATSAMGEKQQPGFVAATGLRQDSVAAAERPLRLRWLQCVRAFAAMSVAAYHGSGRVADAVGDVSFPLRAAFKHGNIGVDLFFVISGFIIAHVHGRDIGRPDRFANYAYRRVTRIYPPYWVLFVFVIPLYFVFPSAGEDYQRHWDYLVRCFFLLPTPPKQVIGVAWTLVYEMIFYAMFALMILNRRIGAAIVAVWLTAVVINVFVPLASRYETGIFLSPRFFGFFFGAAVAWSVFRLRGERHARWLLPVALVAFVFLPFMFMAPSGDDDPVSLSARLALYAAAAVAVAASVLLDRAGSRAPGILVRLGDATYSIYLFHWVIGWVYDRALHHFHVYDSVPPALLFVSMFVLMVAGGYCAHLIVERPLLTMSQTVWRRWHGVPAIAPRQGVV